MPEKFFKNRFLGPSSWRFCVLKRQLGWFQVFGTDLGVTEIMFCLSWKWGGEKGKERRMWEYKNMNEWIWDDNWVRTWCGWTSLPDARGIPVSKSFMDMRIKHIFIKRQRKKVLLSLLFVFSALMADAFIFIVSCWYFPHTLWLNRNWTYFEFIC